MNFSIKNFCKIFFGVMTIMSLQGCLEIEVKLPSKKELKILYYNGGEKTPDLIIINGVNYFFKNKILKEVTEKNLIDDKSFNKINKYQISEARFLTGEVITYECPDHDNSVKIYECHVRDSTFNVIPIGSKFKINVDGKYLK